MTSERVERRLAAVLAADVAGYSRLMGRDEEGTLARLKSLLRDSGVVDAGAAAGPARGVAAEQRGAQRRRRGRVCNAHLAYGEQIAFARDGSVSCIDRCEKLRWSGPSPRRP